MSIDSPPWREVAMSRTVRKVLLAAGILLVLLLVLPFLIPVNNFRPVIMSQASAALGRKVQIGDLSLSILRRSLSAENLSIADDPRFSSSPFLTARSLRVGVELMPLIFSRSLSINRITIVDPQVTLLRARTGIWNYSSLGTALTEAESHPVAFGSSDSSPMSASVIVNKLELENGRIVIGSVVSQKRSVYDKVDIAATDFSLNSRFPLALSAGLPGGGSLELDGHVGPMDRTNAALTPVDAKLRVSSLNLASMGFLDPSLGLGGLLDMDCTVASRNGRTSTRGRLEITRALFVSGGAPAGVPIALDFSSRYDQRRDSGAINPSGVKIGNASARLSGTYASRGESTVVDLSLSGTGMPAKDVEGFLPAIGVHLPKDAELTAGTVDADFGIRGPINRLVTDGTLTLLNGKLAGFNLGARMSAISVLAGINTGSDLTIEKLTARLHIAPDGIRADNFDALMPALGTLIGAGTVDAQNHLDFKMVAKLRSPVAGGAGATTIAGTLSGLLSQVTGGGSRGVANIPFLIQGTTSDPVFLPDVNGLAREFLRSQAGSGGSATTGTQQSGENPLGALGDLFKKKKP
jgi:AsmA protein